MKINVNIKKCIASSEQALVLMLCFCLSTTLLAQADTGNTVAPVELDSGITEEAVDTGEEDEIIVRESENRDEPIEEVVVSIQRSLESALKSKRNSNNLIEVINAEDVGKLPDENVAEVLENIPGVQITRSAGIGSGVSIRGSDQNRVEINSRGTVGGGDQRGGIEISDLPAALIRSLNVVKVPTADMVEGSIGGTINVKTYRGLKLKERLEAVGVVVEYGDNSSERNENLSLTWGDKFSTEIGDIGAIFTLSSITKNVRADTQEVRPGTRKTDSRFTSAKDPRSRFDLDTFSRVTAMPPVEADAYYFPSISNARFRNEERENNSLNGSLQWQTSKSLKLFVEGTYTDANRLELGQDAALSYAQRNSGETGSTLAGVGAGDDISKREDLGLEEATFSFVEVAGFSVPIITSAVIGGGYCDTCLVDPNADPNVDPVNNDGFRIRTNNRTADTDRESYQAAIGGEWEPSKKWLIEFELNAARSKSEQNVFSATFQYNDPLQSDFEFHSQNARIRVPFFFDARDGNLALGPLANDSRAANLSNPDYYSLYVARNQNVEFDNAVNEQKMDFTWSLKGDSFLDNVKFGWRTSQRDTERVRQSDTTPTFPFGLMEGFEEVDLRPFLIPTPGNFMSFNKDGLYLENFLTPNPESSASLRQVLRGSAGLGTAGGVNAPPQGFQVDEKTVAGYALTNFNVNIGSMPIAGNIGLRYVVTDQLAVGNQLNSDGFTFSPVDIRQKYDNALPSASVVLLPTEDIQLRLGYARILRRPNFAELAPTFEYPLNVGQSVVRGRPELRPTKANQYDLTFEYYFRKGSALTLGYYYKDIEGTIGRESSGTICNPIAIGEGDDCDNGLEGTKVDQIRFGNLPGGRIQGIEFGIQHNFNWLPLPWRGFGVIANYAWQDGERDFPKDVPNFLDGTNTGANALTFPLNFPRLSENSYNFTLYFERPRYRFSGRIRYTYRDEFLITESSDIAFGNALFRDDRGQLNASMAYRLTDIFRFTLSGVNLLNETGKQRGVFPDGPLVLQTDTDRRIAMGIRARF